MGVPCVGTLLAVAVLSSGCVALVPLRHWAGAAAAEDREDREAAPPADGEWDEPPQGLGGEPAPGPGEARHSFRFGAWGWDRTIRGEVEGVREDLDEEGTAFPAGFHFEWRAVRREPDGERPTCWGVLVEHFQDEERQGLPGGGSLETEARLTGVSVPVGFAFEPLGEDGEGELQHRWRVDLLPGLRSATLKVRGRDGDGGRLSESGTWFEFTAGLRAEYTPVRGVTLFARGDLGRGVGWKESSGSWQVMAGVRVRPVDHASIVLGWRSVHAETEEIDWILFVPLKGRKAEFAAGGPFVGLEFDF